MPARVLDGTLVADQIRAEVGPGVAAFAQRAGRPPGLGIVLVGDNPASEIYVRNKLKSAGEAGFRADLSRLQATASLAELLEAVERLNRSEAHDGILVQSPLPDQMGPDAERRVFDAVRPDKDVDGFHPINVGRLVQNRATLVAATPSGIVELLLRSNITIAGARAVVVGRSDIVGKPIALLLLHRNATVTVCHSRTANLPRVAAEADLLVVAIGRAAFVTKEFVKPGATVIDVGMNRLVDRAEAERIFAPGSKGRQNFERRGSILVGDVHPDVAEVAGALTPVPGGVGPLTIAMLLKNTLRAAEERLDRSGGSGGSGGSARSGGSGESGRFDDSGGAGLVQRTAPGSPDRRDLPDRYPSGRPASPALPGPPGPPDPWLRVALTGGIATGKSHVLDQFRRRGVPCLDADELAHGVTSAGTEATQAIAARFGAEILAADGAVDRKKLGAIVFADAAARHDLEAIVHPAVYRSVAAGLRAFELVGGAPLALVDVPLLYETGHAPDFDRVIATVCPPDLQIERLVERGMSKLEAHQRLAAQMSAAEKASRADFVIRTDGTFAETDRQVDEIYRTLVRQD